MPLDPELLDKLACPIDRTALALRDDTLCCAGHHQFPVFDGVPVLLRSDVRQTHPRHSSETFARLQAGPGVPVTGPAGGVDDYVQRVIAETNGRMYRPLVGRLAEYPVPDLPLPEARGSWLLDVGCNWGRWSVAAARRGYRVLGIDPSLDAVQAARRVCRTFGLAAHFVVGDARFLPFQDGSIDVAFSFSVLQHFDKDDARAALAEIGRVLAPDGSCKVQMLNRRGLRASYLRARRGNRGPRGFEVRYWSLGELRAAFEQAVGPARVEPDAFFAANAQPSEAHLLPWRYRIVVRVSSLLRRASVTMPLLGGFADAVYVTATRRPPLTRKDGA